MWKSRYVTFSYELYPFLGWVLRITNGMVVLFIILSALFIIPSLGVSLFSKSPIKDIPKGDIVYKIDIDEKVKIDDTVIRFTNVVYDKNGDMNIFYECYDTKFWGMGWSSTAIGDIMDDLGNTYFAGSGYGGGMMAGLWNMQVSLMVWGNL